MKHSELTYDEKKAAEAAFRGELFDPKWSEAARAVYDGIIKAMGGEHPNGVIVAPQSTATRSPAGSLPQAIDPEALSQEAENIEPLVTTRAAAIEAGFLIDVTPIAHSLGLTMPVGISRPLWEAGITASNTLPDDVYEARVRDVLMALRLHLSTSEIASPWIQFSALLTFPPETVPQLCAFIALVHKDPEATVSLTLLLPSEVVAILPSAKSE